jgi:hypothetical protein
MIALDFYDPFKNHRYLQTLDWPGDAASLPVGMTGAPTPIDQDRVNGG